MRRKGDLKGKKGKSTERHRQEAHQALYPLWHTCQEKLTERANVLALPSASVKSCRTEDGVEILRIDDMLMVTAAFERRTATNKPATEEVEVCFPDDIRDLSKTVISWTLFVGDEFGSDGISGGSVAVRSYPRYAAELLDLVTGAGADERVA